MTPHTSMAADPTYPLNPVANIIAAALLSLVLLNSVIRQSWNLGLAFLCFWLFLESLTDGVGGIIWSDNADVRLYVYCDISEFQPPQLESGGELTNEISVACADRVPCHEIYGHLHFDAAFAQNLKTSDHGGANERSGMYSLARLTPSITG